MSAGVGRDEEKIRSTLRKMIPSYIGETNGGAPAPTNGSASRVPVLANGKENAVEATA